ncbi:hypothetical protein ACG02S_25480 [Roseateles sp. DC23W]|uniref:Uncharacterized protein n=1 Tax=Pelomonas dachongensis TaxID=3299029 RepID=A0ABW7EUV4_9BURK
MIQQHPYGGLMVLVDARPEGELYRPAFAVAERADAQPMHSDLLDMTCETATAAFARGREAGELWIDAHQNASTGP